MAQRGGKRPGAGRPKGALSRATKEQKATLEELARAHTDTALLVLVEVAQSSESDAARVSAANAILDRGYGKPKQGLEHSGPEGGPIETTGLDELEIARRLAILLEQGARSNTGEHN
jgi:hypothetical protein